jgi:hypothetical protein
VLWRAPISPANAVVNIPPAFMEKMWYQNENTRQHFHSPVEFEHSDRVQAPPLASAIRVGLQVVSLQNWIPLSPAGGEKSQKARWTRISTAPLMMRTREGTDA